MSTKQHKNYSADFKAKVALEALKEDKTIPELAAQYGIHPNNVRNWKQEFLENASAVFDRRKEAKHAQEQLKEKEREIEDLYKEVGQLTLKVNWAKKNMPNLTCPGKTKRDLVDPSDALPIQAQCELLDLSRSSYYYETQRKEVASELKEAMLEIYEERPFYGHRRMRVALAERGYAVGRKQILRLMRELKLKVLGPKLKTTRPAKAHPKYPYLLRHLPITRPNQVWCADITYLNTPWGYLYFVGILDWATRKVLSWRISNSMSKQFCCEALDEALRRYGPPEIFNTDQGSQFTSAEFTGLLKAQGIQISMNGKGRCTDNVVVERFFGSMKWEEYHWGNYANAQEVKDGIKRYCEFYNTRRHHSSLGYATPDQVYFQALQSAA